MKRNEPTYTYAKLCVSGKLRRAFFKEYDDLIKRAADRGYFEAMAAHVQSRKEMFDHFASFPDYDINTGVS